MKVTCVLKGEKEVHITCEPEPTDRLEIRASTTGGLCRIADTIDRLVREYVQTHAGRLNVHQPMNASVVGEACYPPPPRDYAEEPIRGADEHRERERFSQAELARKISTEPLI